MNLGDIIENRFVIERAAGEGGMGTVYRAREIHDGQAAAVKLLRGGTSSDMAVRRFAREALALSSINHPGIVRYIAHGVTDAGEPYLAMEWVEGEDLGQRLARTGALTVAETIALAKCVAEALGEAHARGILHRDIKPQNLILPADEVGRVKVADFGIARLAAQSRTITMKGGFIGTPAYAAPEQVRDAKQVSPRADIFSLGCVLFECLTGRPAFLGESVMAIFAKILFEELPHVSELRGDVPRPFGDLLSRMLSKDPNERPADGAALAAELAALDLSTGSSTPWSPPALTASEQRIVSVIVARPPTTSNPDQTLPADVVSGIFDRLRSIGEPLSAHVEQLADGSAIAALVGRGVATDQVAQAARCALALRSAIPDVCVAVATGRSVMDKRLPVGDVIDRAVRMLEAGDTAHPCGTSGGPRPIRLDNVTASLVAARFNVGGDPAAPELLAERDAEEAGRTLLGQATPCVGRDQELTTLEGLFGQCVDDSAARAVLVTAPPGTGKSRLRYELVRRVRRKFASAGSAAPAIWIALGDPSRTGSPFGLVGQLLRRAAGISESEPLEVRRERLRARVAENVPAEHATHVAELLGELAGAPFPDDASVQLRAARRDPAIMREQTQLAWEKLIEAETRARPLLLILEDLHWSDGASVQLISDALLWLPESPFMVLALARPEVRDVFPSLSQNRDVHEIRLAHLSRKASRALARAVLGDDVPDDTIERIVELGSGNALYLEELIRAVAEGTSGSFPETVLSMVQSRLEALEPTARQVIRAASIFGALFWTSGVAALVQSSQGTARVDEWLDTLTQRELIQRQLRSELPNEVTYTFRHALIREAAYAMLTEADRALGHRLAAEWMERAFGASPSAERFSVIGDHFARGEAWEKAADYLQRAAFAALSVHALLEARVHCERALECLGRLPDTEEQRLRHVALLLRYQDASWMNDPPERSLSRLYEAERLAATLPGREGQVHLATARAALGRFHTVQQSYATAYKYLQQTLLTAIELGDEVLTAATRTSLALINGMQGHWSETGVCAIQAIEPLARHDDWTSWFMAVGVYGMSLAVRGRYREGLKSIEGLLPRAEELRSPAATTLAHVYALYTHFGAGDMPKILDAAQATVQAAERSRDGMLIWVGSWMGAWAAAHLGDHEAAAKGMARAHALLEQFGGRLFIADWFAAADADRVLLAGRPAEAIALAEKAIQWAKAVESLHAEALARRVLGQALAALDPPRLDEAEPHLAESARLFSASEAVIDRARTDIEWGIVCRARGDHDQARAHFERAAAQLRESDLAFPDHAAAELNRCHAGA